MSRLREFYIVEPPTSAEIQDRTVEALKACKTLQFIVGEPVNPEADDATRPELMAVEFTIKQTSHPDDGTMRIVGEVNGGDSVMVRTSAEPNQPATASLIVD